MENVLSPREMLWGLIHYGNVFQVLVTKMKFYSIFMNIIDWNYNIYYVK